MEILKKHRNLVFIITYSIFLVFFLFNIEKVNSVISSFLSIMSPVIYGIVFAFLVGLIARGIKMMCYKLNMNRKQAEITSIILGYIIFFAIIAGFFVLVIPALNKSIMHIVADLPYFWEKAQEFFGFVAERLEISDAQWQMINEYINEGYVIAYNFLTGKLPDILGYAFNIFNFVKNLGFGLVLSAYMLLSKKSLSMQIKKTITVLFTDEYAHKIIQTTRSANKIFRKYITGQVVVSVVLGIMCYVSMLVFKMPDPVLVSLIIGMSNLIPIVGPLVGSIPATIIVMIKSPIQGLWFLLLVIILQQIEGNLLGPKVLGESVGMSGLWVMLAIILGGGLFGVGGMIIAVPTMGVIYHLAADFINEKYDSRFDELIDNDKK